MRQFTPEGKPLLTIGDPDKPATLQGGQPFNRPTHAALCPRTEGHVYIADRENHRVQIFDAQGRYLAPVEQSPPPVRAVRRPAQRRALLRGRATVDLAVNENVPNLGARVSVLSIKGDLVGRVGGRFAGEQPGEFIAPTAAPSTLVVTSTLPRCPGPREIRSLQKLAMA